MSLGQISFGPTWLSRRVTGLMWGLEHAFERARASGRAEDDTRLRIFFVLFLFSLGFLVLAVGATGTTMRELDDEAMRPCFIAAECRGAAKRESGDVRGSGVRVAAEVGELAAGKVMPAEGRRLFKSVGMAIEDLVAARLVWHGREAASRTA